MPVPETHAIISPDKALSLQAENLGQDVRMTLFLTEENASLTWDFSRIFPLSTRKPWELAARKWSFVSVTRGADSLRIVGIAGGFETSAEFSFRSRLLEIRAQWTYLSPQPVENTSVAFALDLSHDPAAERVTMPQILYNGNPSADPEQLVPLFGKKPGDSLVCEETRFPVPCVNVEWLQEDAPVFISLFSLPDSNDADWSLGCARSGESLQVLCSSGLVALNGKKDQCYGAQRESVPLEGGYRTFREGDRLRKSCIVEFGRAEQVGWGFRSIVRTGYEVFHPETKAILPLDKVIELKANALRNRWREDNKSCGFLCTLPDNVYRRDPYYLFGWSGQSMRLAWCAARLGIEQGDGGLIERGRRAANFYVQGSRTRTSGLRYNRYYLKEARWTGETDGTISARATGETLYSLGRLIRLFEKTAHAAPRDWTEALREGANFLLLPSSRIGDGLFPVFWREDGRPSSDFLSAAGIPCVLGILEGYKVTRQLRCLDAAETILSCYWRYSADRFDRPFARSTLDARCEDKEAGIYFFLAAYELFLLTGDPRFRIWAEVSADWILTFVYLWHTGFLPGTYCAERGFITTGWPGVSVQNHHLDVYFPAYELHDFGRRIGNKRYDGIGRMMFDAWSQGICRTPGDWEYDVPGEQGEQFYQTNWGRATPTVPWIAWRGGYNPWNPSWIIGLVLDAALRFRYDDA